MPLSHSPPCPKHPRALFPSHNKPATTRTFVSHFPPSSHYIQLQTYLAPSPSFMEDSGVLKRRREEDISSGQLDSSPIDEVSLPEAKRLRADDLLFDILDDEGVAGEQDLASVMRSLEEEIGLPSPSTQPAPAPLQEEVVVIEQPDLGFLFEASDDELGLPPTVPSSSDEGEEVGVGGGPAEAVEQGAGFGQIWGFDDEIHGFGEFDVGIRPEEMMEEAALFDGGLFDYPDMLCGLSDVSEFSWRSESLPAV